MNLLDCFVTEVYGKHFLYGKWFVQVSYTCYGQDGATEIMFDTEQEADQIEIGYKFLS